MLSPPSIKNFDARYRICDVVFDTARGAGATGNNENIRYMGFAVLMKPGTFLKLATQLSRPEPKSLEYLESIAHDKGWGPPMLYVEMDTGMVTGHEGRHRSVLFSRMCPGKEILVHVKPSNSRSELRARGITDEMFSSMNQGLLSEEYASMARRHETVDEFWHDYYFVKGPLFSEVFIGGTL
jgi:hypothetical protein